MKGQKKWIHKEKRRCWVALKYFYCLSVLYLCQFTADFLYSCHLLTATIWLGKGLSHISQQKVIAVRKVQSARKHEQSAGASHPRLLCCCAPSCALSAPSRQPSFSKSFSLSFCGGLQTLTCISFFYPMSHERKLCGYRMQGISASLETLPPACESAQMHKRHRWLGNSFPIRLSRSASGHMAKFPDRPIIAQIGTSQQHALQELSSHSKVTHFFNVP